MTEIGNRLGQTHVYVGVAKSWLVQKEFDKVSIIKYTLSLKDGILSPGHCDTPPSSFFILQALDSLQRAQELADGIGNKVTDVRTGHKTKHTSRAVEESPLINKPLDRKWIRNYLNNKGSYGLVYYTQTQSTCDADGLPLLSVWSCVRWRSTAWAKGFIAAGGSRRSSESRWWSSCSVSRSWSSTAACVESPSGTGTKNCRPYPVPTSSISSGYSSTVCCLLSLFLKHLSWDNTNY